MSFIKNPVISILFACFCTLFITACTPKNSENNSQAQSQEGAEIVTDFSSGNFNQYDQEGIVQIDDFFVNEDELVSYHGRNRNVTIPKELGVTSIGWGAFSHSSVSSLVIPKEIRSINGNAFENCHSLQSITVSEDNDNFASVDGVLFNKQKTELLYFPHGKTGDYTIPNTVTVINDYTFTARSGLSSVSVPASVVSIGNSAFDNTVRLESITVDRSSRNYASKDGVLFDKLETAILHFPEGKTGSYTIPNTITRLGDNVFRGRNGITSVTIPNSVTRIGKQTFNECHSLASINIPGSVTNIGESAFNNCSSLTSVTLNEGLTNIQDKAFYNCTAVTSINIPASVRSIGTQVFTAGYYDDWLGPNYSQESKLASISVDQRNQNYSSVDGALYNKAVTELIHFPQGKTGSYSIPDTVTKIERYAFSNRSSLTSVTIPASITSIGEDAFFGCAKLTSINVDPNNQHYSSADGVLFDKPKNELIRFPRGKTGSYTIPNTVTNIGNSAFAKTSGLTSITIPSSVTTIGDTAFAATGLKTLSLPNSITKIGSGAFTDNQDLEVVNLPDNYYAYEDDGKGGAYFFYGCVNLKRFMAGVNNKYYSTVDGVLLSKDGKDLIRYPYGRQGPYTIPGTVTTIKYKAFYKAEGLTSITIPAGVKHIGDFAFDGSGITSVDIPNGVTSIGKYAFTRCTELVSVSIPASVVSIGDFAFYNCTGLEQFDVDQNNKNYFLADGVLLNRGNSNFVSLIRTSQMNSFFARYNAVNSINER